jgi:hypothetical protein
MNSRDYEIAYRGEDLKTMKREGIVITVGKEIMTPTPPHPTEIGERYSQTHKIIKRK